MTLRLHPYSRHYEGKRGQYPLILYLRLLARGPASPHLANLALKCGLDLPAKTVVAKRCSALRTSANGFNIALFQHFAK